MHDARDFNLLKTIVLFYYISVKKSLGNLWLNYLESLFPAQSNTDVEEVTMLYSQKI